MKMQAATWLTEARRAKSQDCFAARALSSCGRTSAGRRTSGRRNGSAVFRQRFSGIISACRARDRTEVISGRIYSIRGRKVMLDRDLAELYGVPTKVLKQAVRRNGDRFPEDFMFELGEEEFEILRSQIVTSSWGGVRYMPMAFTEQGVAMLLGNVWCRSCREAGGMQLLSGKIEKGQLVLRGTCAACGKHVAKVVERAC
jgi:hypothetical protein